MTLIGVVLSVIALLFALPVAILMAEVICAVLARNSQDLAPRHRLPDLRVAVIVPAHDEEDGIGATVSGIAEQLGPNDRLVVVADNCTDATADRARAAGAETTVRLDPHRRGKGYALDFGLRYLEGDPPDVVVIVDADCRLGHETINTLVASVRSDGRAVQAFYAMNLPPDADAKRRVAGFAWIVKNHVRPTGLATIGLPCQLMGTGMAFSWDAIRQVDLATGNIVEDVKLGLDLAAAGHAPRYCPQARVESDFPATERGYAVQRQRWEAGSVATIVKVVPAMFLRGLRTLNFPLLAMAIDLIVPPLLMLLAGLFLGLFVSIVFELAGGPVYPAILFGGSVLILLLALALAWLRFGRATLRPGDFLELPGVFVAKSRLYGAMWRARGAGWVRTDRK